MNLKKVKIIVLAAVMAIAAWFFSAPNAFAELLEVKQTIWGMDCAPCAYGVETGLKKLKGAKEVKVSLNHGYASVKFEPNNTVTLDQIRTVVSHNGFEPKDAHIRVAGQLTQKNDKLVLSVGPTEYLLVASPSAKDKWEELKKLSSGQHVVIKGYVPSDTNEQLQVLEFSV